MSQVEAEDALVLVAVFVLAPFLRCHLWAVISLEGPTRVLRVEGDARGAKEGVLEVHGGDVVGHVAPAVVGRRVVRGDGSRRSPQKMVGPLAPAHYGVDALVCPGQMPGETRRLALVLLAELLPLSDAGYQAVEHGAVAPFGGLRLLGELQLGLRPVDMVGWHGDRRVALVGGNREREGGGRIGLLRLGRTAASLG